MRKILWNILQRNTSSIYDARSGGTRKISAVKEQDFNVVTHKFIYEIKTENEKKIAALVKRKTDLLEDRDELGVDSDERKRGFMTGRIHELDLQIEEIKKTNYEL